MSSTSFSTASSSTITTSESFETISSNDSTGDDADSYCKNNFCIYCWNNSQLYMSHSALRPLKNQKKSC